MLDSHSDLVAYFDLPDTSAYISHFAKAELTPVDWMDPVTWVWRIDEAVQPAWLADVAAEAEAATRRLASRMILKDATPRLIVDGCWIVGGASVVRDVRGGRILRVQDSAQIQNVWDSAQIQNVWGSAQIRDVWDSAQIRDVGGSAQIQNVCDSAQLDASARAHVVELSHVA